MNDIAKALFHIKEKKGTNAKKVLLEKYKDLHGFKDALQMLYNPYIITGISDKKLNGCASYTPIKELIAPKDLIEYFKQNNTGREVDVKYALGFIAQQETAAAKELAEAMVTKTLTIGCGYKTINKVYGDDFIPVIGVMLARTYEEGKTKLQGKYIGSRKADGVRRLLIKENGTIKLFTRKGLPDFGLVDIIKDATSLPDNSVYDGELEAIGSFKDNIAKRQATNSIANSSGERTGVTFNIFDMITLYDFKAGESKHTAEERKMLVDVMFGHTILEDKPEGIPDLSKLAFITSIPIDIISDKIEEFNDIFADYVAQGEEGMMLVKADSTYKVDARTKDWLKLKRFEDIDLNVIEVFEGVKGKKYEGMLGGVYVEYKGSKVGVGSGFTDEQRKLFWEDPSLIVGKVIEITSQGESVDNSTGLVSLNCAIFKGIREDK